MATTVQPPGEEDTEDEDIELVFRRATEYVGRAPPVEKQVPREMILRFYGAFKQATEGDIHTSRPFLFTPSARAKW